MDRTVLENERINRKGESLKKSDIINHLGINPWPYSHVLMIKRKKDDNVYYATGHVCAYRYLKGKQDVLWVKPKIERLDYIDMIFVAFQYGRYLNIGQAAYENLCMFYPEMEPIPVGENEDTILLPFLYVHWLLMALYYGNQLTEQQFDMCQDKFRERLDRIKCPSKIKELLKLRYDRWRDYGEWDAEAECERIISVYDTYLEESVVPPFWIDMATLFELYVLNQYCYTAGYIDLRYQPSQMGGHSIPDILSIKDQTIIEVKYRLNPIKIIDEGKRTATFKLTAGKRVLTEDDMSNIIRYQYTGETYEAFGKASNMSEPNRCVVIFPDEEGRFSDCGIAYKQSWYSESATREDGSPKFKNLYYCGIPVPMFPITDKPESTIKEKMTDIINKALNNAMSIQEFEERLQMEGMIVVNKNLDKTRKKYLTIGFNYGKVHFSGFNLGWKYTGREISNRIDRNIRVFFNHHCFTY